MQHMQQLQTDYTVSRSISADPYHVEVIRGAFTRNIAACFADVQDEIRAAFSDHIPMTEGMELYSVADGGALANIIIDWIEVPAYQAALQIICRASNRMFIGLPLCEHLNPCLISTVFLITLVLEAGTRNISISISTTLSMLSTVHTFLTFFRTSLSRRSCQLDSDQTESVTAYIRIVAFFTTPRRRAVAKAEEFLGQNIRERLHQEDIHGKDWPGKPVRKFYRFIYTARLPHTSIE